MLYDSSWSDSVCREMFSSLRVSVNLKLFNIRKHLQEQGYDFMTVTQLVLLEMYDNVVGLLSQNRIMECSAILYLTTIYCKSVCHSKPALVASLAENSVV